MARLSLKQWLDSGQDQIRWTFFVTCLRPCDPGRDPRDTIRVPVSDIKPISEDVEIQYHAAGDSKSSHTSFLYSLQSVDNFFFFFFFFLFDEVASGNFACPILNDFTPPFQRLSNSLLLRPLLVGGLDFSLDIVLGQVSCCVLVRALTISCDFSLHHSLIQLPPNHYSHDPVHRLCEIGDRLLNLILCTHN
jgi:hypothetical protein